MKTPEAYWSNRLRHHGPLHPVTVDYTAEPRTYLFTGRQHALILITRPGKRYTLRSLASATGYSLGGLRKALAQLASLGLFRVITRRGRLGWTKLIHAQDVYNGPGVGTVTAMTPVKTYRDAFDDPDTAPERPGQPATPRKGRNAQSDPPEPAERPGPGETWADMLRRKWGSR